MVNKGRWVNYFVQSFVEYKKKIFSWGALVVYIVFDKNNKPQADTYYFHWHFSDRENLVK